MQYFRVYIRASWSIICTVFQFNDFFFPFLWLFQLRIEVHCQKRNVIQQTIEFFLKKGIQQKNKRTPFRAGCRRTPNPFVHILFPIFLVCVPSFLFVYFARCFISRLFVVYCIRQWAGLPTIAFKYISVGQAIHVLNVMICAAFYIHNNKQSH